MSNVGAVATNLHEGSRSEYLAQYVFASFGTATPVPHQEDAGVDLYCTMTEQVGRLSWPRYYYTVQVKSTMDPWRFGSADSVRWLVEHPFPLFLCVLDKSAARLRLYHTFPRFLLWVTGTIPNSLELVPDEGREGHSTQWENGTTFSLGAPILDRTILELLDDTTFTQARAGVESWLQLEARNLVRVAMRVPIFSMPYAYETNATTFGGGTVFQSSTLPERFDSVRDTLGDVLPWLAEAYRRKDDLRGMARAALLLRHLFPSYDGTTVIDHSISVQMDINKAMGLKPEYVFEGVDLLAKNLDKILGLTPQPPPDGR